MKKVSLVLIALALVVAACGSGPDAAGPDANPGDTATTTPPAADPGSIVPVTVDVPRADSAVTPEQVAEIRLADTRLGLELFWYLTSTEEGAAENVFFSPYSIATALSMLYAGSDGMTTEQMADVMNLTVPEDQLHPVRNYIDSVLSAEPPPPTEDDTRAPFVIRPANSVWGQTGYPFNDEFLTTLAQYYGAGLQGVDFTTNPDGSRQLINGWVEDATEDRIKDLLPDGSIDDMTRLVLVNAIWFKANWAEEFDPKNTADGAFTLLDDSTVTVPLMHGSASQYAETDDFQALRLPYAGDAAMVVLLPKGDESPADLAARLVAEDFVIDWGWYQVQVTLPKFELESDTPLADALKALGMTDAFDPGRANLNRITDGENDLYVSDALHKAFISVDEEGTEAAAATALIVSATSAPPPATFTADRPFLFWIEHNEAGVLFMGQITNPS